MESELLSLKEVAKILRISPATVNYYGNIGLFQVAERRGNTRFYEKGDILARFEKIKSLRKQGYSLSLIQRNFTEK
jgi:DNA-binding transcriptional MerR regulator